MQSIGTRIEKMEALAWVRIERAAAGQLPLEDLTEREWQMIEESTSPEMRALFATFTAEDYALFEALPVVDLPAPQRAKAEALLELAAREDAANAPASEGFFARVGGARSQTAPLRLASPARVWKG